MLDLLRAFAFAGVGKRASHRRPQASQVGFQHVVGRAAFEARDRSLLSDYAGNKQERRRRTERARQMQRRAARIARERVVAQYDIRLEIPERTPQFRFRRDTTPCEVEAVLLQRTPSERNVRLVTLDQ